METTNYQGVLRNLTTRNFHRIVALHRLDVHTSFPVDNSAAFWPLLLKTPLATRTAQSLKVLTAFREVCYDKLMIPHLARREGNSNEKEIQSLFSTDRVRPPRAPQPPSRWCARPGRARIPPRHRTPSPRRAAGRAPCRPHAGCKTADAPVMPGARGQAADLGQPPETLPRWARESRPA